MYIFSIDYFLPGKIENKKDFCLRPENVRRIIVLILYNKQGKLQFITVGITANVHVHHFYEAH